MADLHRVVVVSLDKDVLDMLEDLDDVEVLGFLDADPEAADVAIPNLGRDAQFTALRAEEPALRAVLAVDPPALREKLAGEYGPALLTVVSRSARVSRFAEVGEGTIVQTGVYVSRDVKIGFACKLNVGATVHHDSRVGNYVTLAPGAQILGSVTVDDRTFVGAGATILPNLHLGEGVTVGAGAVVTKDVQPRTTVAGVPARAVHG